MVFIDLTAAFALMLATSPAQSVETDADPEAEWYTVERADETHDAGRLLARAISDHLDGDVDLVDISELLDDDGATVTRSLELVLVNEADAAVITAQLDDAGSLVRVDVLRRPRSEWQRRYRHTERLRNSVIGKDVSELMLVRDKHESLSRVELVLDNGDHLAIDVADFDPIESVCGG